MLNPSIKRGVTVLQNFPLLSGCRVCGSTVSELAGTKILRDLPDSALNELPVQEQRLPPLLSNAGRTLYVHTVITGGQEFADSSTGFGSLAESTSQRNLIVWINEYFGRVEREGKQFVDIAVYKDDSAKIFGRILLAKRHQDTFGRDFEELISRKLTMEEGIVEGPFSLMSKQRIG
jgi:hypothetical protein